MLSLFFCAQNKCSKLKKNYDFGCSIECKNYVPFLLLGFDQDRGSVPRGKLKFHIYDFLLLRSGFLEFGFSRLSGVSFLTSSSTP